jgi:hypothetical protein
VQAFARRQLGSHLLVDVGAFSSTTDPAARFGLELIVQPISEQATTRIYGPEDKQRLAVSTRQKVAFDGERLRFVGPPDAGDRAELTAMLDAGDRALVGRIASGYVSDEATSVELGALPPALGELAFVDPRGLVLVWEGTLSDAEAASVRALPADPELRRALEELVSEAQAATADAVTTVTAPLGADQVPSALRGRVTFGSDASGASYASVSWTGLLFDAHLRALEGWAQIRALRDAVDELRRLADAARFTRMVTPPRPLPSELPAPLQGRLLLDAGQLTWVGPAPSDAERASLLAVRGDAGFDDARARLLAVIDEARDVPLPPAAPPPPRPTAADLPALLQGRLAIGDVLGWSSPAPTDAERQALLGLTGDAPFLAGRDALLAAYDASHSVPMLVVARRPRQADVPPALASNLTIEPEAITWSGRVRDATQLALLSGLSGDAPFDAAIASLLASLGTQVLTAVFVSPVRPAQSELGGLGSRLLLGRALLRHQGLMAAEEARELSGLFGAAVDQRAVERLYRRSHENPLRQRSIELRARRGSAAPSALVELPLTPLSTTEGP